MAQQDYSLYTEEDQQAWTLLYNRQLKKILKAAHYSFLHGLHELQLSADAIPDFVSISKRLTKLTGWSIYGVPGLIDNKYFFEQLQSKHFGATTWMRGAGQIDYLEEPDLFHDVFGHVPQLANQEFCKYLQGLALIANQYIQHEAAIEAIARLYWYTIEFGLIRENTDLEIYGAGIISSVAETDYCLSDKPRHLPFNVEKIIATPYIKDKFQEQYFVIRSLKDLTGSLGSIESYFQKRFAKKAFFIRPEINKIY